MRIFLACLTAATIIGGQATAQEPSEGEALFERHCASCHGAAAEGDGPLSGALLITPPDLTALSARNDGIFPMQRVIERIDGQDPLASHGSPMPVFGPFFQGVMDVPMKADSGQPVLVSQPIADIVAYLRSIQMP
ncbi:cytochrome c [Cognatishimia sp. F0-27]|uniref:c-type cytochrome n=1 Tax=Cognatishimia sp. F0-27 TaxID=2816855 RepID=UPI001D0C57E7|nr:cytochrome c [Cognatishimia sp. F0-27]